MAQSSIFYLPEVLEHILHFLLIDKSIYPALYVSRLWYRCGAPILWRRIELKKGEREDCTRLKKFMKIVCKRQKPVYSSNLTHLEISTTANFGIKNQRHYVLVPKHNLFRF